MPQIHHLYKIDKEKQSGLTLLEVLVSFVIMTISITLILQIITKTNRALFLGNEYNKATMIAESLLASIVAIDSLDGDSGTVQEKFRWMYSIRPYAEQANISNSAYKLYEISLLVNWDSIGKQRDISLKTLRLMHEDSLP